MERKYFASALTSKFDQLGLHTTTSSRRREGGGSAKQIQSFCLLFNLKTTLVSWLCVSVDMCFSYLYCTSMRINVKHFSCTHVFGFVTKPFSAIRQNSARELTKKMVMHGKRDSCNKDRMSSPHFEGLFYICSLFDFQFNSDVVPFPGDCMLLSWQETFKVKKKNQVSHNSSVTLSFFKITQLRVPLTFFALAWVKLHSATKKSNANDLACVCVDKSRNGRRGRKKMMHLTLLKFQIA